MDNGTKSEMDMQEEEEEAASVAAAADAEVITTPEGGRDESDSLRSLLDAEEGDAEAEDEDENEAVASVEDDPVRAMVAVRRKENKFVRCIILIYIYLEIGNPAK